MAEPLSATSQDTSASLHNPISGRLSAALDDLVDDVFTQDWPTPKTLEASRENLPPGYKSLAGLLLGIRQTVRWAAFGPCHASVRVTADQDTVSMEVRVDYSGAMCLAMEYALRRAGFADIQCHSEARSSGVWMKAVVPPDLLQRLQDTD